MRNRKHTAGYRNAKKQMAADAYYRSWRRRCFNFETLEARQLLTAVPRLVSDINSNPLGSSDPAELTPVGNVFYFSATDGVNGKELWKSDGKDRGTEMVKDINPGSNGSLPGYLTNVNGTLFFVANDGVHGRELWISDGTESGTKMVTDLFPGDDGYGTPNSSSPTPLGILGGKLIFAAADAPSSDLWTSIWASDGTAAGTVKIKDVTIAGPTFLSPVAIVNNSLFFVGDDPASPNGLDLWKTDGTEAGTVQQNSSNLQILGAINGQVIFGADDDT